MYARSLKHVAPKRQSASCGTHGSLARICCAHAALTVACFAQGGPEVAQETRRAL